MTTIPSEVAFRVSETGADAVGQSFDKINEKIDQSAKSTSNLTKWIKENRREQAQQNFLFREGANLVGTFTFATIAFTSATGNASKGAKQLNETLVTGYSAFQAANFAMSGLGIATGGWGLAAQAAIGVGAALLSLIKDTGKEAKQAAMGLAGMAENMDQLLTKARRGGNLTPEQQSALTAGLSGKEVANLGKLNSELRSLSRERRELLEKDDLTKREDVRLKIIEKRIKAINEERQAIRGLVSEIGGLFGKGGGGPSITPVPFDPLSPGGGILGSKPGGGRPGFGGAGVNASGILPGLQKRQEEINILLKYAETEKEITGLVREREGIEETIASLMETSGEKQLRIMGGIQLGASLLSSTLDLMGVKTDSVIQKLLKGLQAALQIFQTIQTIGTIFKIGSAVATAGASTFVSGATGLVSKAAEGGPGIKGGGVNITINAVDAHSIRRMMSDPANASAFASSIAGRQRLGKSSPFG